MSAASASFQIDLMYLRVDNSAGILHFSFNPNCEPAAFLANFATRDPGTQTMWNSMMHIPNRILNSATGIPESTFTQLKSNYQMVTAPGTGGEACMQKCGLSFNAVSFLNTLCCSEISESTNVIIAPTGDLLPT